MKHSMKARGRAKLPRRPACYRPRLESLEDRLPPGDTVLGGLLAWSWTQPALFARPLPSGAGVDRAPEGRPSLARGARPWDNLQGSGGEAVSDSQGWRPGPPTVAPAGLSAGQGEQDFADWDSLGGRVAQSPRVHRPIADLQRPYVATDGANGFMAPTPPQPLWVTPALPAAEGTGQEVRLPASLLASAGDTEAPPAGPESGVHALFNLDVKTEAPFPTNWFTVADRTQNTGKRVNLPLPDCQTHPSDCEDVNVLNTLDGFNLQPRLSIPFDGPIDVNSVSSHTVFLVSLGDTLNHHDHGGQVVGINQVVWDVATTTLHAESDELLAQHTRYALIVTNGLHDTSGGPVEATSAFRHFRQDVRGEYKHELLDAIHAARRVGVRERDIVTAGVFTTQSATAILEKIRDQIKAETPKPADFLLGEKGERTVFELDEVTGITWNQQTRVKGPLNPVPLDLQPLRQPPGVVGRVAFGKYLAPNYRTADRLIPPIGTRSGIPIVHATEELYFNLFLPSGRTPAGGWPVAIFGHGNTGSKQGPALIVAASMAAQGVATLAINTVGHGFGPLGTLVVSQTAGEPVTLSAGGRGLDEDGDGIIGPNEGIRAAPPYSIIDNRDGQRQTVADLMQLVRVLEVGMDIDGDGSRALDPSRIYYFGQSLGGIFGTMFVAVEPSVHAGVLTVPGTHQYDYNRLGPGGRPAIGNLLANRTPSLVNSPGVTVFGGVNVGTPRFQDNLPLRDGIPVTVRLEDGTDYVLQSPVTNTVAGAMAIQAMLENRGWVSQSGSAGAYAPHLRKAPLPGMLAKSVIVQFATGDQTVPNPVTTTLLRAGDLADRATFYRHDLAFAEDPTIPQNPHVFLTSAGNTNPLVRAIAGGAQAQIAVFFASDGKTIIHPEPARFFEVPIQGPLPEDLNYIP